jgi:hypothetical protein
MKNIICGNLRKSAAKTFLSRQYWAVTQSFPTCWLAAMLTLVFSLGSAFAATSWPPGDANDVTVVVPVEVQSVSESPASITFKIWRTDWDIEVFRKDPAATEWGTKIASLPIGTATWTDTNATVGTLYEYKFSGSYKVDSYGYIYTVGNLNTYVLAGIRVDRTVSRGRLVLVMPTSIQAPLAAEIANFKRDLVGDGWTVHTVLTPDGKDDFSDPGFGHVAIREDIMAIYNAHPGEVKQVILLGRVPVARSGLHAKPAPDGHSDLGANAADCYYADVDNTWTDLSKTDAAEGNSFSYVRGQWQNAIGDGRFDQTHFRGITNPFEMGWGRIDFRGNPDEIGALRGYLNKLHNYKFGANGFKPGRKAVAANAGDNMQEEFWKTLLPVVGLANGSVADASAMPGVVWQPEAQYSKDSGPFLYLFTGRAQYKNSRMSRAVFWTHFISHTGYWDTDGSMRERLAEAESWTLSFTWMPPGGRYIYHKMGMGGTMGDVMKSTINSQNNVLGLYGAKVWFTFNTVSYVQGAASSGSDYAGFSFMGHMGDPTLRDSMVESVTGVRARLLSGGSQARVEWTASPDAALGYNVYSSPTAEGPFTKLTASPVHVGTTSGALDWTDPSPASDPIVYMVRGLRMESTAGGTYLNASVGATVEVDRSPAPFAISTASLTDAYKGVPYRNALATEGGNAPAAWAITAGALPPGLAMSADGILSGTPSQNGIYPLTFQTTDLQGVVLTTNLTLAVKEFAAWTSVPNAGWDADPFAVSKFNQTAADKGWTVMSGIYTNWYRDAANLWGYSRSDGPNGNHDNGLGVVIRDNKATTTPVAFRFSWKNTDGTGMENDLHYRIYGINGDFSWALNTNTAEPSVPTGTATLLTNGVLRGVTDWTTFTTPALPITGGGYDYFVIRLFSANTSGGEGDLLAVDDFQWATVPVNCTATFAAGPGGSITGNASQTVACAAPASDVTAVPAAGYEFVNWTWSGGNSTANPIAFPSLVQNLAITANFRTVPAASTVQVTPASATLLPGVMRAFFAVVLDQYNQPVASQPSVAWSVAGGGSITAGGVFTAGAAEGGPYAVTATAGGLSGNASVTVFDNPPVLTGLVDRTIVSGGGTGSLAFTVSDPDHPASGITVTGRSSNPSLVPDANIVFGGSGESRTVTVTSVSGQSGSATITVTIGVGWKTSTWSFVVTVDPEVATSMTVSPATTTVQPAGTRAFAATVLNQLGTPMLAQPQAAWSVTGGGSVDTAGVFTAGPAAGGPFTLTASAAGFSANATIMVGNTSPTVDITSPGISPVGLPDLTDSILLVASVNDAEVVPAIQWTQVSGPAGGQAVFASATSASTGVRFPVAGTYVLRITVSDGLLTVTDEVTVGAGVAVDPLVGTNIGTGGYDGTHTVSGGTITVNAGSGDIWTAPDRFYLLSTPLSGNFTVSARVASLGPVTAGQTPAAWAKAGVMIRQSTAANSAFVMMVMTPGSGWAFQTRTAAGALTNSNGAGLVAPYWVRLVRSGTTISAFRSVDGIGWSGSGSTTISMTDPVQVGFAASSNSASSPQVRAVFDNISGFPAGNDAPQVNPGMAPEAVSGAVAALAGSATDDARPVGSALDLTWSLVSGPGVATFANAKSAGTSVTFSAPGSYVVRLAASDGSATAFQDMSVTVASSQTPFEEWSGQHGLTGGNAGDLADPDADGIPNLVEYAIGGHPGSAASAPRLQISVPEPSVPRLQMDVPRVADPSLTYEIWASDDLVNWGSAPVWSSTGLANASGTARFTDSADLSLRPKRFLRLKIIRN